MTETPRFVTHWRPKGVIEAVHLTEDLDWDAVAAWCGGDHGLQALGDSGEFDGRITVDGLAGAEHAYEGDWIVKHTGGFRVWEDGPFRSAYDSAPAGPPVSLATPRATLHSTDPALD